MNQSEIELIQRIKQGDASAFKTLFTTYYAPLCAYAQRYVVQIEAAEEIVQDLFMRQWDNRQHFELHTSFRSYMYRAVRNNCIDYLKHIQIQRKYEKTMVVTLQDTVSEKIDKLEELELQQRIDDAIDKLPEQRKRVFLMNRFDGLKYREIAEKLGISIKTVEAQMGSALKHLREQLAGYLDGRV